MMIVLIGFINCFGMISAIKIPMDDNNYMIGSGIYDITGPAAEVG